MAKTADTIAIYSRKSRYTGKGKVSEIRSTSAANISAPTTEMPLRNMPLSLRTRAFPAAT